MTNKNEQLGLRWVRKEIDKMLEQTRQGLEAYAENDSDVTHIRFCVNCLHQVRGTLEMLEFHGAVLLVEEMETFATSIEQNKFGDKDKALEVLMNSLLHLPGYLDRVNEGHKDLPVLLLPLLNELRACRKVAPLSESAIFAPNIQGIQPPDSKGEQVIADGSDFKEQAKKLRHKYQKSLLGVMKGQNIQECVQWMHRVLVKLEVETKGYPVAHLWWVADGFLLALVENSKQFKEPAIHALLGKIERHIKRLADIGTEALNDEIPDDLIKNLLYYVAKSNSKNKKIIELQETFKLKEVLPEENIVAEERRKMSGPDSGAISNVISAINDDLINVKDSLDLFVRGDDKNNTKLEGLIPNLQKIGDTLGVLGLGIPRDVIKQQIETLNKAIESGDTISDALIMDVAGALLFVEANLSNAKLSDTSDSHEISDEAFTAQQESVSAEAQFDDAKLQLLKESYVNLQKVKERIIDFIASSFNIQLMRPIPELLSEIQGGLKIIGFDDVSNMLGGVHKYILENLLNQKTQPSETVMDALADILTSIEYCLENYAEIGSIAFDSVLSAAQNSYDIILAETERSSDAPEIQESEPEVIAEVSGDEVVQEHSQETPLQTDNITEKSYDESLIDDEVLEIFIEEAEEELESISKLLPQWIDDTSDEETLSTLRRSFHTLKGSGRLVGASVVGELAWTFEDMLNRVIEGSLQPDLEIFGCLREVKDMMPTLVEDFSNKVEASIDPSSLMKKVKAITKGMSITDEGDLIEKAVDVSQEPEESEVDKAAALIVEESSEEETEIVDETPEEAELEQERYENKGVEETILDDMEDFDPVLLDIFINETETHLKVLDNFCQGYLSGNEQQDSDDLLRALHTLKGSAHMAEVDEVVKVVHPFESLVREYKQRDMNLEQEIVDQIPSVLDYMYNCINSLRQRERYSSNLGDELAQQFNQRKNHLLEKLGTDESEFKPKINRDPELLEIFLAEGMDIVTESQQLLNGLKEGTTVESKQNLQAEMHTLKRGANMAMLSEIEEIAAALEKYFSLDSQEDDYYDLGHKSLEQVLEQLNLVAIDHALPNPSDIISPLEAWLSDTPGAIEETTEELKEDSSIDDNPENESTIDEILLPDQVLDTNDLVEDDQSVELAEENQTLEEVDSISELLEEQETFNDVELPEISELSEIDEISEVEDIVESVEEEMDIIENVSNEMIGASEVTVSDKDIEEHISETIRPEDVHEVDDEIDEELLEFFLEEAEELFEEIDDRLSNWKQKPKDLVHTNNLQRHFHTLKGSARMAGVMSLGNLAHALEDMFERLANETLDSSDNHMALSEKSLDVLRKACEDLRQHHHCHIDEGLISDVKASLDPNWKPESTITIEEDQVSEPAEDIISEATSEVTLEVSEPSQDTETAAPLVSEEMPLDGVSVSNEDALVELIDLDEDGLEVFEIYLEEAEEILENMDDALQVWSGNVKDKDAIETLQRSLHTLKGGARLSGLTALGNLTHELESYFELVSTDTISPDSEHVRFVMKGYDVLQSMIDEVKTERKLTIPVDYMTQLQGVIKGGDLKDIISSAEDSKVQPISDESHDAAEVEYAFEESSDTTEFSDEQEKTTEKEAETSVVESAMAASRSAKVVPLVPQAKQDDEKRRPKQQEQVRIAADQLENLVNLAGETSIFRTRLDQQVSVLRLNLEEMNQTVERLREQLRVLEIETDAQIEYRLEIAGQDYQDFDPLEFDRYTRQQELTRILGESASDLVNLKESLDALASDSETLLLQQGRVNTEMQERLMRTRMVPFESLVPRLRRIVRQIGNELGKTVDLAINADGEMDRTILEKMIAPIEHMLRNAMDHGIESPEERKAVGKTEAGKVRIRLYREGAEVFIEIQDDGRGLNIKAIREKAIERGLISSQTSLTDHELQQLIFEAGFSTAESVTQISGRGVGMDVVSSEIKQMGGVVEIDSVEGKGTTFTVKLPFTVSVNQALMVQVGDDIYAIPLTNIEGIVRVSPYEVQEFYDNPNSRFEYAGMSYTMRYMGQLLDHNKSADLTGVTKPLPILLLHGTDHPTAIQVDELMGSREIVVKSVGQQLSLLSGLSGATILGDGRVVLILDVPALTRRVEAIQDEDITQVAAVVPEARAPRVMVVDDSITVRKVTQRLLNRHDYEVFTAKDGVDALNVLHDNKPDVMLLDIEMPRMDGFELATIIRHDETLKDLPIIMITSRTGEKHRQRAESIGVNHYMGKPYNEVDLLQTIEALLPSGMLH